RIFATLLPATTGFAASAEAETHKVQSPPMITKEAAVCFVQKASASAIADASALRMFPAKASRLAVARRSHTKDQATRAMKRASPRAISSQRWVKPKLDAQRPTPSQACRRPSSASRLAQ